MVDGATALGWRIGSFALKHLVPEEGASLRQTEVWDAYMKWCGDTKSIPVSFATFYAEFDALAQKVGIERKQFGAHVSYHGVKLKAA